MRKETIERRLLGCGEGKAGQVEVSYSFDGICLGERVIAQTLAGIKTQLADVQVYHGLCWESLEVSIFQPPFLQ